MTVVNPKSISGINSITMASGSDNLLTIHTTNTTERLRINSSGDVIVGSGITASPDGNIFATGVTTSTTFVGALTGNVTGNVTGNISGGTVAGSTGTFSGAVSGTTGTFSGAVSGTTGTFSGTATFNDTHLDIADSIRHIGDSDTKIRFPSADTFSVETGGSQAFRVNSNGEFIMADSSTKTFIDLETTGNNTRAVMSLKGKTSGGGDVQLLLGGYGDTQRGEVFTYTNHDLGFATNNAATQFKCKTNGNFEIVNGDLVVASGHGIDFSATGGPTNGSGTSEVFDDYEEGTYNATVTIGAGTITNTFANTINYTKVGRVVHVIGRLYTALSQTNVSTYQFSLPFACMGGGSAVESGGALKVFRANAVSGEQVDGFRAYRIESGNAYAKLASNTTMDGGNFGTTNPHIIVNCTYHTA